MNKVTIIAANGKTKAYKTKGNFDVRFNVLAPSIRSSYFFKQTDLDFINNELVPLGISAYEARIFVIGGKNSTFGVEEIDGRNKSLRTLPYLHWDDAYQFIMDNSTQGDVNQWLR